MAGLFDPAALEDVDRLIAEYPLAWVISRDFKATPLPLLAEHDEAGRLVSLLGHFARHNPQIQSFEADAAALILFSGPDGYISPTLVSRPKWGPTWNYAVARFEATIEFIPHDNADAIAKLVAHVEPEGRWSIEHMEERYEALIKGIVAFRAHIKADRATFKLGQDEKSETFWEIVEGLGNRALAQWMAGQQHRA